MIANISTNQLSILRFAGLTMLLLLSAAIALSGYMSQRNVFYNYDWMLITGLIVLWFGLKRYTSNTNIFNDTIERLVERNAIHISSESPYSNTKNLTTALKKSDLPYLLSFFSAMSVAIAFLYAFSIGYPITPFNCLLMLFEVLAAMLSGYFFGTIAVQGSALRRIKKLGLCTYIIPGHPDKTGGWAPYANLLMHQSSITALPVIYISIWAWLINYSDKFAMYDHWKTAYGFLPLLAAIYLVQSLLVPLYLFYKFAKQERSRVISDELPGLATDIAVLETSIRNANAFSNREHYFKLVSSQSAAKSRMESIQNMPLLLVSFRARRTWTFSIAFVGALASFIGIMTIFE